jgi:hypothetical protein
MNLPKKSQFIIVQHFAEKAGVHFDLRFEKPEGQLWDSFVLKKEPPLTMGKRILAVKTHDHNKKDALTIKPILSGYGKGTYKKYADGYCTIEKYHPSHIVLNFNGTKIKGIYHLVSLKTISKDKALREYLFFKGRTDND